MQCIDVHSTHLTYLKKMRYVLYFSAFHRTPLLVHLGPVIVISSKMIPHMGIGHLAHQLLSRNDYSYFCNSIFITDPDEIVTQLNTSLFTTPT